MSLKPRGAGPQPGPPNYPVFLLVHSSIDDRVGYINLNDVQWITVEGTGSEILVNNQIWHLTETATYIASGGTQP